MATSTTMTGAQFDALPEEEWRKWELLDGELIEVPSATLRHQAIISRIISRLNPYFEARSMGPAYPDVEFSLGGEARVRPDLSLLLGSKWAALDPDKSPIPGAPSIAVEVISPSERTLTSSRKVRAYLRHGTEEVWQVYPEFREVWVYAADGSPRVFGEGEQLTTKLLPGWVLPVGELF